MNLVRFVLLETREFLSRKRPVVQALEESASEPEARLNDARTSLVTFRCSVWRSSVNGWRGVGLGVLGRGRDWRGEVKWPRSIEALKAKSIE
ncbi:hypothetical protein RRG08_028298 [Elysia crispata]|uniref:Uncharacterized protein n=1 Tax=Elysia crispata TaxID=231223 RepID=A0AAE1AXE0_9GAST|nr:hypothetical protein RRG08_028298 [Elysia crispata]